MTWALGLFTRLPRWTWAAGAAVLALVGLWVWHQASVRHADHAGYARAMAEVQAQIAKDKAAQAAREAQATITLTKDKEVAQTASIERTKEIDNATRNIPDQAPTARQRARACLSLRAEAKANDRAQPAC